MENNTTIDSSFFDSWNVDPTKPFEGVIADINSLLAGWEVDLAQPFEGVIDRLDSIYNDTLSSGLNRNRKEAKLKGPSSLLELRKHRYHKRQDVEPQHIEQIPIKIQPERAELSYKDRFMSAMSKLKPAVSELGRPLAKPSVAISIAALTTLSAGYLGFQSLFIVNKDAPKVYTNPNIPVREVKDPNANKPNPDAELFNDYMKKQARKTFTQPK
jgi:hypothetical protein